MTEGYYNRKIRERGTAPVCQTCKREIKLGDKVVTKKNGQLFVSIRHEECAERVHVI